MPADGDATIYGPLLRGEGVHLDGKWNTLLAHDYAEPAFHISYLRAVGRRLRKNYAYILTVQAVAYYGKLAIHPTAVTSWSEFFDRAAIGPIPGLFVVTAGLVFHGILGRAGRLDADDRESAHRTRRRPDLDRLTGVVPGAGQIAPGRRIPAGARRVRR